MAGGEAADCAVVGRKLLWLTHNHPLPTALIMNIQVDPADARGGKVLHDSSVSSLKHFKDNVKEMPAASECGIGVEGFSDFEVGDILELYRKERQ